MRVTIEGSNGTVLDVTPGADHILVPLDGVERSAARRALIEALYHITDAGGLPTNDDSGPCVVSAG